MSIFEEEEHFIKLIFSQNRLVLKTFLLFGCMVIKLGQESNKNKRATKFDGIRHSIYTNLDLMETLWRHLKTSQYSRVEGSFLIILYF